ncbi:hypothetical protein [Anthocerotibacter panamensis]|uniref:hypothetical protein n=1 Tax=Anthocerotibacter panamensis TaxID=2857077 RepID=UPI001C40635E|nr:hypothetical protein [Anthocerotibacter panamensis]
MTMLLNPPTPTRAATRSEVPWLITVLVTARKLLILALGMGLLILAAGYWWTVKAQDQWSEDYRQIEKLSQAAQELEWATGVLDGRLTPNDPSLLAPPRPDQLLLIKPAAARPLRAEQGVAVPVTAPQPPLAY